MDSKIIGAQIRAARLEKNLSQEELAQLISISSAQVGRYERGDSDISSLMLYQISIVLEKPIDYFYCDMKNENVKRLSQELNIVKELIINSNKKIELIGKYLSNEQHVINSTNNKKQRVAKKQFRNTKNTKLDLS